MSSASDSHHHLFSLKYKDLEKTKLKHFHFSKIDSTNTWAKLNLDQWEEEGMTLITASEQTGGRGRFKRIWVSPKDVNIYATFCFSMDKTRNDIGQIPQLLAFSAVQVLESYQFSPLIKWPNDILIEGKKLAGILCETIGYKEQLGIICGIGLNVNMALKEIQTIDQPATSLLMVSKREHKVEEILEKLIHQFIYNWQLFLQVGFCPFFLNFREKSAYIKGQQIRVIDGLNSWQGEYVELNEDGSLKILRENGKIKDCMSGEIVP